MEWLLGCFDRVTAEHLRIGAAWLLVMISLLWVLAFAKVVAPDEPPWVLHLSLGAFWVSVATLLIATDLEKGQR